MGMFPEYTAEELAELQVSVPNVEYYELDEAAKTLEDLGLEVKVMGEGDTVKAQIPASVKVESGSSVVLYTEDNPEYETVIVPNLKGLTKEQAKNTLADYGLNLTAEGSGSDEENAYAKDDQSVEAGKRVPMGTAISVTFGAAEVGSQ